MTDLPTVVEREEMRKLAERLVGDVGALEERRNLAVYELDARLVARWLLRLLSAVEGEQRLERTIAEAARRGISLEVLIAAGGETGE